jgi:hypothetical protein
VRWSNGDGLICAGSLNSANQSKRITQFGLSLLRWDKFPNLPNEIPPT